MLKVSAREGREGRVQYVWIEVAHQAAVHSLREDSQKRTLKPLSNPTATSTLTPQSWLSPRVAGELIERADSEFVPKQGLGGRDDQRLTELRCEG